ncbi:MAG: hypothetical protein AAFO04_20260 [Cyanobacteria bacterium J06592_8]
MWHDRSTTYCYLLFSLNSRRKFGTLIRRKIKGDRMIDESGEDYAFSVHRFYPIQLPQPLQEVLLFVYPTIQQFL